MPIFEIQMIDKIRGEEVGYKFVKAKSESYIRKKPSLYVGPGVRIGFVYRNSAKTLRGAKGKTSKRIA